MSELFKEVKSENTAHEKEAKASEVTTAAPESAEKQSSSKGKHGDPGVCCGGCS
ncbi:CCGSCS motif protein [Marinobacter salexigens]|uniref:CCGSCS motif protein n=1 Tax=Marinobacter salexigens TaxID=1925763 RepID=UPI0013747570|nr:CCGSCS motif protein [Marinobacter salexigens]